MDQKRILLALVFLFLASCGGSQGGFMAMNATVEPTYTYETPQEAKIGDYEVVYGAMQVSDVQLNFSESGNVSLAGAVSLIPKKGGAPLRVPIQMGGDLNGGYSTLLKSNNTEALVQQKVKTGAKLLCLTDDCRDSLLDIYVNYAGKVYHQQLRAKTLGLPGFKSGSEPKAPTQVPDDVEEGEPDHTEDEHYEREENQELGPLVGANTKEDLDQLFKEQPKKTETPQKKDTPGSKEPTPKKDEDTKKKKDQPGQGAKKQEPSKEAPEAKKEEPPPPAPGVKKLNQAVGAWMLGSLRNAVSLLEYEKTHDPTGLHIIYPKRKRYFSTTDLLVILAHMGQFSLKKIQGYVLQIGDLSREKGGRIGHQSHQNGLDADIAYYFDKPTLQKGFVSAITQDGKPHPSWMVSEQWELFKYIFKTNNVDRIFVHEFVKKALCQQAIKAGDLREADKESPVFDIFRRLRPDAKGRNYNDHANHFHLRLKCSQAQGRDCLMPQKYSYLPNDTGCF